ncbi:MAG: DinB family protein [Gemmatimonadota bacterium]|nr:DinB family protein [Gemmatimonadota bacterium]
MESRDLIRQLFAHSTWADAALFAAVRECGQASEPWREYTHILGAEEVWLARMERRPSAVVVWPSLTVTDAESLRSGLIAGYDTFIATLDEASLSTPMEYRTSAGQPFNTPVRDMLLQVLLHGQYHRGKINLLLRQDVDRAAPVDYIRFVRGVPAAVTPPPRA